MSQLTPFLVGLLLSLFCLQGTLGATLESTTLGSNRESSTLGATHESPTSDQIIKGNPEDDDEWMHSFSPVRGQRKGPDGRALKTEPEGSAFWRQKGQDTLSARLDSKWISKEAKNIVFFLGDGMSLPTVTAARVFKGQKDGLAFGEESTLSFEKFPHIGISKTFCSDSQVADSACSATAYLTGTKGNIGTIGVKPSVKKDDCKRMMDKAHQSESILAWAQAAGKSTGVVTTTRITHASPAGTYAHVANRNWENDHKISKAGHDPERCDDIAEQLILREPGKNINVIFGGGRREFLPKSVNDPVTGERGKRTDDVNLIDVWKNMKEWDKAQYIWDRDQLLNLNTSDLDYVLGLFNYDHLAYVLDNDEGPQLPELVETAIEILSKNPKGFFLFVEGGRIDHAHHDGKAQKALVETVVFSEAVEKAVSLTEEQETLILITSDHAHTMAFAGYPERGNPIFGIAGTSNKDNLPYSTLSYANGPGYRKPNNNMRYDIINDALNDKDYRQIATAHLSAETHGGDDVMIFSKGPFAHLLTGVVMQSYIPHALAYASCVGDGRTYCKDRDNKTGPTQSGESGSDESDESDSSSSSDSDEKTCKKGDKKCKDKKSEEDDEEEEEEKEEEEKEEEEEEDEEEEKETNRKGRLATFSNVNDGSQAVYFAGPPEPAVIESATSPSAPASGRASFSLHRRERIERRKRKRQKNWRKSHKDRSNK